MQTRTRNLLLCVRALADPVRLKILSSLPKNNGPQEWQNVSQLAKDLKIPQPTVSHHLGVLRNAGLVRYEKSHRDVRYWVDAKTVDKVVEELKATLEENT